MNQRRVVLQRLTTKCKSLKQRGVLKEDVTTYLSEIDLYSYLGISKELEERKDLGICSEYS